MELLPGTSPVYVSYGNYLFDIAKLMAEHQDATIQSSTVFTQYEQVLEFDARMKTLATKGMAKYFHVIEPIEEAWPEWIPWARKSLTICLSHKILMIHRDFIGKSFTDQTFAMTRKTCIAASKTILGEAKTQNIEGPIIWIDKAFCIVAAIILCMDLFHAPDNATELHRSLVVDCIDMLCTYRYSVIAVKGANLLAALLRVTEPRGQKRAHPQSSRSTTSRLHVDTSEIVRALDVSLTDGVARIEPESWPGTDGFDPSDDESPDYRQYPELFPPQVCTSAGMVLCLRNPSPCTHGARHDVLTLDVGRLLQSLSI